jgi:hypothetical protein
MGTAASALLLARSRTHAAPPQAPSGGHAVRTNPAAQVGSRGPDSTQPGEAVTAESTQSPAQKTIIAARTKMMSPLPHSRRRRGHLRSLSRMTAPRRIAIISCRGLRRGGHGLGHAVVDAVRAASPRSAGALFRKPSIARPVRGPQLLGFCGVCGTPVRVRYPIHRRSIRRTVRGPRTAPGARGSFDQPELAVCYRGKNWAWRRYRFSRCPMSCWSFSKPSSLPSAIHSFWRLPSTARL